MQADLTGVDDDLRAARSKREERVQNGFSHLGMFPDRRFRRRREGSGSIQDLFRDGELSKVMQPGRLSDLREVSSRDVRQQAALCERGEQPQNQFGETRAVIFLLDAEHTGLNFIYHRVHE